MTSTRFPGITSRAGRPAFVVNVEVFLERDGRWLFIERGAHESQAPGALAGVGGKVEGDPVINVVFTGRMPATASPAIAAPGEVAAMEWLTVREAEAHPNCPSWILGTLRRLASE
ncbi:hypothetical protein ACQPYK_18310 [Streptosporangium sp. CA-135522]|uniref:hypothetical protein n=1 Tax=Streptosporangium sp. CA-135522 TaxID=3240072 RepID=UPI003D8B5AD7